MVLPPGAALGRPGLSQKTRCTAPCRLFWKLPLGSEVGRGPQRQGVWAPSRSLPAPSPPAPDTTAGPCSEIPWWAKNTHQSSPFQPPPPLPRSQSLTISLSDVPAGDSNPLNLSFCVCKTGSLLLPSRCVAHSVTCNCVNVCARRDMHVYTFTLHVHVRLTFDFKPGKGNLILQRICFC